MNKPMVYLAGPISGLNYEGATDWREYATKFLAERDIIGLSPMRGKIYLLNESEIKDKYDDTLLSSQAAITARDRFDCTRCDAVLFNFLNAPKTSIGTCIEIGWADAARKPMVLCIEESGNMHDHAMIRQMCGWRAGTLDESLHVLCSVLLP